MTRFKRFASALVAVLTLVNIGSVSFAQTNNSQTANGFRISPVRNEVTIEKGKSATITISVENPSGQPFKAKAIINDFVASDNEDGQPKLLLDGDSAPSHSLRKLIQTINDVDFAPKERKQIPITITIPSDARAGGYYGAVRFTPVSSGNSANVNLTASVGSLFLVNVPGNIKEHLALEQFSAAVNGKAKSIITSGQVSIITRLKNDGDTHEKPFGKIQVKNSKGAVVAQAEINAEEPRLNVLPDSIRKFETKLSNQKWFGHYTVTASFGYEPSNSDLINAKTSFWYIPLWLVIVAGLLVLTVLIIGYIAYHKISTRRFRKNRTQA